MKHSLFLFALLFAILSAIPAFSSRPVLDLGSNLDRSAKTVYACKSETSYSYYSNDGYSGSNRCSHPLKVVSTAEAENIDYTHIWGKPADIIRVELKSSSEWHQVDERIKGNLRIIVYQNQIIKGLFKNYCFEDNRLTTIRIDRDPAQCLAPLPQGVLSTQHEDTWCDITNNVTTQRRFANNVLSD